MSTRNAAIDEAVSLINGLDWGTGDRWRAMSEAKCAVMDLRRDDEPAVKVTDTDHKRDNMIGDMFTHGLSIETDAGTVTATVFGGGDHMEWSSFEPSAECWKEIGTAVEEAEAKFK